MGSGFFQRRTCFATSLSGDFVSLFYQKSGGNLRRSKKEEAGGEACAASFFIGTDFRSFRRQCLTLNQNKNSRTKFLCK
jgi:hypothetical protein